jgi:hypothetical protein
VRRKVGSVSQWDQAKRELRLADERAVKEGRKNEEQLKRENSHFVAQGSVRLVFNPGRV